MDSTSRRQLDTLELAVYRARRVQEHSLCASPEILVPIAEGRWTLETEAGAEEVWLCCTLPPEEAMESLAARCRPFILEGDPVHYSKCFNALGYFVRNGPARGQLDKVRAGWLNLRRDRPGPLSYISSAGPVDGPLGSPKTDRELAYQWLYGDVLHANDTRSDDHHLGARYQAGAFLVGNIAMRVLETLTLIRQAEARGELSLPPGLWEDPVVTEMSYRVRIQRIIGAAGTVSDAIRAAMESPKAEPTSDMGSADGNGTAGGST